MLRLLCHAIYQLHTYVLNAVQVSNTNLSHIEYLKKIKMSFSSCAIQKGRSLQKKLVGIFNCTVAGD